jgi:alpha-L-rhamnosidase
VDGLPGAANPDYLRARGLGNSYNDWLAPGDDDTPHELLATAYWAYDAALMAEIADATGRADDAARYRALWSKIRSAFAEAFVAADGQIASGTQTAYVLGLHMGLVPEDLRAASADRLVAAIRSAGWHLTTGLVGVGYILPALSAHGHADVAYRLLEQDSPPSRRYMVEAGATTIWERWDGWTAERGFQSPWMNSFNHYTLGSVGEWLHRFVLGIDQAPGTAGFGQLLLRPYPGGSLSWARGSYRSVRGPISTGWNRSATGSRSGRSSRRTSRPASASPATGPTRSATPRVTRPRRSPASRAPGMPTKQSFRSAPGRTSSPAPQ